MVSDMDHVPRIDATEDVIEQHNFVSRVDGSGK